MESILKVDPVGWVNGLDVEYMKKRETKDVSKVFSLRNRARDGVFY